MNDLPSMDAPIARQLTFAQALMLSECLDRLNKEESLVPFVDDAERQALLYLDCALEAWNPVILNKDYAMHLHEAKFHIIKGLDP